MYFGDITGLSTLSSRLSNAAATIRLVRDRGGSGVQALLADVTGPEIRAAATFASRWADVGTSLASLAGTADSVSSLVGSLAQELQLAASRWSTATHTVLLAGGYIDAYGESVSVTPPVPATPTQLRAISEGRNALQNALADAQEAWSTARTRLAEFELPDAAGDLVQGPFPGDLPESGDGNVDDELRRLVPGLLSCHQAVTTSF